MTEYEIKLLAAQTFPNPIRDDRMSGLVQHYINGTWIDVKADVEKAKEQLRWLKTVKAPNVDERMKDLCSTSD